MDCSHVADQVAHFHFQRIGDDLQRSQRHTLLAGFDPVQVNAVQPGQLCQLVLAFLHANRLDFSANNLLNVLQRLQTSSLPRSLGRAWPLDVEPWRILDRIRGEIYLNR